MMTKINQSRSRKPRDKEAWAAYMREYYRTHPRYRARMRALAKKQYAKIRRSPELLARERARSREKTQRLGRNKYTPHANEPWGLKRWARQVTWRAIQCGKLKRPGHCERCGRRCKPQAHHHDYHQPLKVVWYCQPCHRYHHRKPIGQDVIYQPRKKSWVIRKKGKQVARARKAHRRGAHGSGVDGQLGLLPLIR